MHSSVQQPVSRYANDFQSLNNDYHPSMRTEVITPVGRTSESFYKNMGSSPVTVVGENGKNMAAAGTDNNTVMYGGSLNRKAIESEKELKCSSFNRDREFAGAENGHIGMNSQAPMPPFAALSGIGRSDNGYDSMESLVNLQYQGQMPEMPQDVTGGDLANEDGTIPYLMNHYPPTYSSPRVQLGDANVYHASPTAIYSSQPSGFGSMVPGNGPTSQFDRYADHTGQYPGYNSNAQAFQPIHAPSARSQGFLLFSDAILGGRRGIEQVSVSYHPGGMDTIQIRSLPMPMAPLTEGLPQGGASLHIESWNMFAEHLQSWARSLQSTCQLMQLANPGSPTHPTFSFENGVFSMTCTLPHHARNQQRIDAALAEGDRIINHQALNRLGSDSTVFGIGGSLNLSGGPAVNSNPSGTNASGQGKAATGVSTITLSST